MKLDKKKVFALALAACLIATLSMGSLAWFTDDDSVTNDFFIAGSEDQNPDDVFSVDVWEDATPEDPDGEEKIQDGIKYPAILPGDDLYKEVNVENTGAYEQYARVIVTVSDAHIWQELHGEVYVPLNKIATDLSGEFQPWSIEYDADADALTYVLYYNHILAVDEVVNLFTNVAIPEALNRDQAAAMAGGFQINVVAEAVQTENVGANAAEAFATVGMAIEPGNTTIMANMEVSDTVFNTENMEINGGTIKADAAGLENSGTAVLTDVKMEAGTPADYSNILYAGSVTTYDNVEIVSGGGGIAAVDGAKVIFNSGSVEVNTKSTSGRYLFYAEGEGTVITINGGEFVDFTKTTQNQKRAYVYAGTGTTVYINGGTFGAASTRSGYTAGIMGDGTVIITGGTFGFNPSAWVADGYEAVQNGTTWTVQAK